MDEMCKCLYCNTVHGEICRKLREDNKKNKIRKQAIQRHADVAKELRELFCAVWDPNPGKYIFCPNTCICKRECKCGRKCECGTISGKLNTYINLTSQGGVLLLMQCFKEGDTKYGNCGKKDYSTMISRFENGDANALLSLIHAFNTRVMNSTGQDIGVFNWVIQFKDKQCTLLVPVPLTVGNYCRLMAHYAALNQ